MKVLYSEWMQELDRRAIEGLKIPSIVLMENASQGAARFFRETFPPNRYSSAAVIAGRGNNGGDGIAVGRILAQKGYRVTFLLAGEPEELKEDARINFQIIKNLGLPQIRIKKIADLSNTLSTWSPDRTFVIDALFGTGLTKPVRPGIYLEIIKVLNQSSFPVASVDIPSGLSEKFLPDGESHIIAHCTATFQFPKVAHLYPDGNRYCGKIQVIDIGIPKSLLDDKRHYINLIHPRSFPEMFDPRPVDSHKGHFGHCLTIAGSHEKPGAGILCAYSALKSGAGLCTAAVREENRKINIQAYPELMELPYRSIPELMEKTGRFTILIIGPGLGENRDTREIVSLALKSSKVPVILDADGLNVLSQNLSWLEPERDFPLVLTPHPGEFARLTNRSIREIISHRIPAARDFAHRYRLYLVLKGHHTIVATPEGEVFLNQTGNPGMASAGSGDVLGGIITGLMAQHYPRYPLEKILQAAVFIHGHAADLAAADLHPVTLTAKDLVDYLPPAFRRIHEFKSIFQFS